MNKLLLFLFALVTFPSLNAQNKRADSAKTKLSEKDLKKHLKKVQASKDDGTTIWDYDTIFDAGVPYCIIHQRNKDYTFWSFEGKELIWVEHCDQMQYQGAGKYGSAGAYAWYFMQDTTGGRVKTSTWGKVWKKVVEYNLIDGGKVVNADAEAKFIAHFK